MTVIDFVSRLDRVRKNGSGWAACCPSHGDRNPSLSISEKDRKILLHCHAGCEPSAIVAALSLQMADLFIGPPSNGDGKRIGATYDYTDESGKLLFQVVRYEPKDFKQRRPDGKGGWVWKLNGTRRVLYRLPEALKSKAVLVCEGEKDAETARKLGLIGTCNPHGAGKWKPEYTESLRGKRVAVICDADPPGLAHGRDVARSLVGVAESVWLIEALPQANDLSEWVGKGGTRDQLLRIIKRLPELTAADAAKWNSKPSASGFQLTALGELLTQPEEAVSWLLDGILPAGGLSLLAAKPKAGKSTLARCLALAVARGAEFLGRSTAQGTVIYLALEEKQAEVRKHFADMGADGGEPVFIHCAAAPQDAMPSLTEIAAQKKPALIIVDPLLRMVRLRDGNDYAQVSTATEPLITLARQCGAHLLCVHHMGKGERAEATDSILGSTALYAAVDTALLMKRSEQYRTLQSRQRYGQDLPETVLEFNSECRWIDLGAEKSHAEATHIGDAILEFLRASDEPRTEEAINEAVEGKASVRRTALRDLVKAGKVARQGDGKRGKPYSYSLPEPGAETTPEGFSVSQSPYIPGLRDSETKNGGETRINTGSILSPGNSGKPFLSPGVQQAQKPPSEAVENSPFPDDLEPGEPPLQDDGLEL